MDLSVFSDEHYMQLAYREAQAAYAEGEIPVGAVVVCNNKVLAKTHNQTETLNDVTAHAEMLAITAAANVMGAKYLNDCTIYITLEPCPMCASALEHAHMGKVVWAASDPKNGFSRFGNMLHPKSETATGIMADECAALLTDFFASRRKNSSDKQENT